MSTPQIKCPNCKTSMPYTAAACPNCKRRMIQATITKSTPATPQEYIPENETVNLPYRRCRDCNFWVMLQDEYCPNCGIIRPQERLDQDDYLTRVALDPGQHGCFLLITYMVLMIPITLIAAKIIGRAGEGSVFLIVVGVMIITLLVVVAGVKLLKRSVGIRPDRTMRSDRSLSHNEKTINWRLKEIKQRQAQIQSVQTRAGENTGEQWERVRQTLQDASGTLKLHQARYSTKLIEVEAVRWQNSLTPLLYGWEGLNYESNEKRLKALDEARLTGAGLRSRLDKERKTLGDTSDFKELSSRLDETLASCKKVHDGLVGRQAVLALKGMSPLKDAISPVVSPTSERREMEVFNIQVAITDFSSSFAELESEYTRLQSEEDVAQEISRILERADDRLT